MTTYRSTNETCYFGIDLGSDQTKAVITKIRYFPRPSWTNVEQKLNGAKIYISNDNIAWQELVTVDGEVHSGWNYHVFESNIYTRYIKFEHNITSHC